MDLYEYRNMLLNSVEKLKAVNKTEVIAPLAEGLLADIKTRLVDGKATDGGSIGNYSTKPMTAGKDAFVDRTYSFGAGKKSVYLPGGYKQLRQIQSLPTGSVNMKYRGEMLDAYEMVISGKNVYLAFTSAKESGKRRGNEARFKKPIFYGGVPELAAYSEKVQSTLAEISKKALT